MTSSIKRNKSEILEVTIGFSLVVILMRTELCYTLLFMNEIKKIYLVLEAKVKFPSASIFLMILFDIIRCHIVGTSKMLVLNQFSFQEIENQFPKTLTIMAIVYLITNEQIEKYYTSNKYWRALFNMEFRFLKSIDYLRFVSLWIKLSPDRMFINFILIDITESALILSTTWVQQLIMTGKWNLRVYDDNKFQLILNFVNWTELKLVLNYFTIKIKKYVKIKILK